MKDKETTYDEAVLNGNAKNERVPILTEVTSIAKEEARTGEKIDIPSVDELVSRASASFIKNRTLLEREFKDLSGRAKTRVLNAILDLPTEGVPVLLKDEGERKCFAYGQRIQMDRLIILQHYINLERNKNAN